MHAEYIIAHPPPASQASMAQKRQDGIVVPVLVALKQVTACPQLFTRLASGVLTRKAPGSSPRRAHLACVRASAASLLLLMLVLFGTVHAVPRACSAGGPRGAQVIRGRMVGVPDIVVPMGSCTEV